MAAPTNGELLRTLPRILRQIEIDSFMRPLSYVCCGLQYDNKLSDFWVEAIMARTEQEWEARPVLHERDYVDSRIYTDPDIFRDEREFVFRKTWKFICHESEMPVPCDYRTFEYAGYPLIVARDINGQIRAFINSCSHRSALVLREAAGNAKSWTCLYHNWVYDTSGKCISIPREEGYEEAGICKADQGLREIRVETRHDLVFVNLDTSAISFDDYIGDALESLTSILATGGLEVFSSASRSSRC